MPEDVPCINFPNAETIKIPLPFGVDLCSIADISGGPPTDSSLAQSLMLQVSPLLASMTCLFKILKVMKTLLDILDESKTNPLSLPGNLIDKLPSDLLDLSSCFLLLDPCKLAKMIAGILQMILSYLGCLIEAFESIWNFQIGIDLNAAQGNPVLLASLECAQRNAQTSLISLNESLEGIKPLLDMIGILLEAIGQSPLELPPLEASTTNLADLAPDQDPLAPIKTFRDALQGALDVVEAIC